MQINRRLLDQSWRSWVSQDMARSGPYWLQLLWTQLFSMVVALGFTVLGFVLFGTGNGAWRNLGGWAGWYGRNLVVAMTIGFTIHALYEAGGRLLGGPARIRRFGRWQRSAYFNSVPLLGVTLGWPLGLMLAGVDVAHWFSSRDVQNMIAGTLLLSLLLSTLIFQWFSTKARQIDAERRAAEARLRLLQGQIEPHFLFNTLANVSALIDIDAARAKQMLESFTDHLRSSLTALQHLLPAAARRERLRWLRAGSGELTHQVAVDDVLFFRADDKYTCVQTATAEHLIRTPIAELAQQLDPAVFMQVHRSTIVNIAHLAGTRRDDASRLFLRLRGQAVELPVSRAYVHLFKAM